MSDMTVVGVQGKPGIGSFAVAPELAADAYKQIAQLQDVVGEMVRQAKVLGRSVPLGGGYAAEIGRFMADYGIGKTGSAVEALTDFGRELETLKNQIAKALKKYQAQDEEGVDCIGG
ncbi:hypothetical protein SAMN05421504_104204 [Amycolatopsis xylanica]|uniref:Excreted virulence factor EspC, type VII ESX diderm n=2 Tax=Amycolatopsis xylanica TaxID=589385 RepID=A0A1H3GC09_9PSEU|nr:hypothetical protein [Amycolatopsis xylanica]SDY00882.1 hypothetical protein SAMN05421504_104204 [Amycolatopsis xylanica]